MKITEIKIKNFQKISAVDLDLDSAGNLIQITGANESGKTSLLQAIRTAVMGKTQLPDQPVKDGQRRGNINLELDDVAITVEFNTKGKYTVEVIDKNSGEIVKSPQRFLKTLKGALTFDALAFIDRMDKKQQIAVLKDLAGCGETIERLDAERKSVYEQRTEANREMKFIEGKIDGHGAVNDFASIPDEPVDFADLSKQLADANKNNLRVDSLESQRTTEQANVRSLQERIDRLTQELASAKEQQQSAKDQAINLDQELKTITRIDTEDLTKQMGEVQEINARVKWKQERKAMDAEYDNVENLSKSLSDRIKDIDQEKIDAIKNGEMPIDGLMFDEDGVYLDGIPLAQLSSGKQTELSVQIGMAMNPALNVILIQDGSLLDSSKMQIIANLAEKHNYQVWIERVYEGSDVGIFMTDGHVGKNNYEVQ